MIILVKGITIRHLAFALEALINEDNVQIHIITEEPEIGLSRPIQPGSTLNSHPLLKIIRRHLPRDTDEESFIRGMWLSRALGIEAAERGASIHLRSSLLEVENGSFRIIGAGRTIAESISFDSIYNPEMKEGIQWYGASFSHPCEEEKCMPRGDGTCEHWSMEPFLNKTTLETSIWFGKNPFEAIPIEIEKGSSDARESLQSPKYS